MKGHNFIKVMASLQGGASKREAGLTSALQHFRDLTSRKPAEEIHARDNVRGLHWNPRGLRYIYQRQVRVSEVEIMCLSIIILDIRFATVILLELEGDCRVLRVELLNFAAIGVGW